MQMNNGLITDQKNVEPVLQIVIMSFNRFLNFFPVHGRTEILPDFRVLPDFLNFPKVR